MKVNKLIIVKGDHIGIYTLRSNLCVGMIYTLIKNCCIEVDPLHPLSFWRFLRLLEAELPAENGSSTQPEEPVLFLAGSTIVLCDDPQIARKPQSLCGDI